MVLRPPDPTKRELQEYPASGFIVVVLVFGALALGATFMLGLLEGVVLFVLGVLAASVVVGVRDGLASRKDDESAPTESDSA